MYITISLLCPLTLSLWDPWINVKFWECTVTSPYDVQTRLQLKKYFINSIPNSPYWNWLDYGTEKILIFIIMKHGSCNDINEKYPWITHICVQISSFCTHVHILISFKHYQFNLYYTDCTSCHKLINSNKCTNKYIHSMY
jgi:hypothetical protein